MNSKYRNTPYYNKAINILQNLNTSNKNKELMANSVASLLERNKDLDINEDVIMERLRNLEELVYEDYDDDVICGYSNASRTKISIENSLDKTSELHDEVLVHELMHQLANPRGIQGLEIREYKYINEVFTQINTYEICKDLGIENFSIQSRVYNSKNLKYPEYGEGYSGINRVGQDLMTLDRKSFMEANFNPDKVMPINFKIQEKIREVNDALNVVMSEGYQNREVFIESMKKVDESIHNLEFNYMKTNDFEKYWDISKKISQNNVQYGLNPIERQFSANSNSKERFIQDIAMYGLATGMDINKINAEINSDNHSSQIMDFTLGCELLRRYNVDVTLEDIQNAKIKTASLFNREYITIKINDETYQGVGIYKDGNCYIEPRKHYMPFGAYRDMAISENDLTSQITDIKFDENSYLKYWINQDNQNNPEVQALYATYFGEYLSINHEIKKYDGQITNFNNVENLIKEGKLEKLLDNIEINSLKDYFLSKDDSGKMKIEEILESDNWKGGIKAISDISRSNYFTELPCTIDYERLSKMHGENVLVNIYENDRRMLDLMIEKGADINYTYNNDNIINHFSGNVYYSYKDTKSYFHLKDKEDIGNSYEYFVNNGLDLNSIVKDGPYFTMPVWEQILLKESSEDARKLFESSSSKIYIEEVNPPSVVSEIFHKSDSESLEKLKLLTDLGINIEKEDKKSLNSLNTYELVAADYLNSKNPDKKEFMMEVLKHDFDFSRKIKEEVDTIGGYSSYFLVENDRFFGYGLMNSGHLLLKTQDADLIVEAIESPETKISFKDVFNARTPSELLDAFSEEDKAKFKELEARLELQTATAADKLPDLPLGREDIAADILPLLPTEGRDIIHFVSNEDLPDLPMEMDTSSRDTEDKIQIEEEEYELDMN